MNDFRYYTDYCELYHHGVKGMHWGIRRYQNPDGTLTESGKNHYRRTAFYQRMKANSYQTNIDRAKFINKIYEDNQNAKKTGFTGLWNNRFLSMEMRLYGTISGLNKYRKNPEKYEKIVNDIIKHMDESGYEVDTQKVTKSIPTNDSYIPYSGKYHTFKKKSG